MITTNATVFVVDDDAAMRDSLRDLIRSVGLRVELFDSAQDFLQSERPDVPGCLVLDVRMPGQSGLDLQRRLNEAGVAIPIIFITGHGDVPMGVCSATDRLFGRLQLRLLFPRLRFQSQPENDNSIARCIA